jgi:hypothetical protein
MLFTTPAMSKYHTMGKKLSVKETKVFYLTMLSTAKIICYQQGTVYEYGTWVE